MKYSAEHFEITKRFWDGTQKVKDTDIDGKEVQRIIQLEFNQAGKKAAIERAVVDLMARTLTPTGVKGKFSEDVVDPLLKELDKWFIPRDQITEESFDKWHANACDVVLGILRKFYYNDKDQNPVQYGKAQKIVNMTMKELYCLPGSEKYEKHFGYCHIALDSFTLEWIQRNIFNPREKVRRYLASQLQSWSAPERFRKYRQPDSISEEDIKTEENLLWVIKDWEGKRTKLDELLLLYDQRQRTMKVNAAKRLWREELTKLTAGWLPPQFMKGKVSNWSLIPDETTSFYGYDEYVRWIRIFFSSNHTYTDEKTKKAMTPFQAEFYIWSEIQLELAAEAFYGQDIGKYETVEEEKGTPEWETDNVDEKDFDAQFKWCKERFKEYALDKKMTYLSKRIQNLQQLLDDSQTQLET